MKKCLFLGVVALTGCLWADRTANRDWVAKNFAPSNVVTRVEALEAAPPPVETDPAFTAWTNGSNVAVGSGAAAAASGAVQIGSGSNSEANTLQFRDYQLLDADGMIPTARLPEMSECDPAFSTWQGGDAIQAGSGSSVSGHSVALGFATKASRNGAAVGPGASAQCESGVAVGDNSYADGTGCIAIGKSALCSAAGAIQLGSGENVTANTLQVGTNTLLDANGKIPAGRLSAAAVLATVQAMTAEQKAALKTALGL